MADGALIFNPITIFLAALGIGTLLYLWGRTLAPRPKPYGHKQEMYTGGEAPKPQEIRPSYEFFHVALFFTVLHVAALVIATAPGGPSSGLALLYVGILGLTLWLLRGR